MQHFREKIVSVLFGRVLITKEATWYALLKKMLLEILQCLQENTCTRVFFNKVSGWDLKHRLCHRCFLANFVKFLRTPFLQTTSRKLLLNVSLEGIITKLCMFILFYQNFYNTVWREDCNKKVSFAISFEWCLETISFF